MPSCWFPYWTSCSLAHHTLGPEQVHLLASYRKGNPGSNNSTLWTRTALSPASPCWHHPCQPVVCPATKEAFPKRKREHTTPSAYNPSAALCCPPPGKPSLLHLASPLSLVAGGPLTPPALSTGPSLSYSRQLRKHECSPHNSTPGCVFVSLSRMPAPSSSVWLTPT